jgi:cation-transporting ATPase 13A1
MSSSSPTPTIQSITLHRPKELLTYRNRPIRLYHLLFTLLYLHQIYWIASTIGTPYQTFLLKAESEGFTPLEGTAKLRAELTHALSDLDDPNRVDKVGWFSWMNMDIEEHAKLKRREKEKSVLDSLPKSQRVPKRYMPSFGSLLTSGMLVTLHLLVVLLQVWSVKFRLWMNYVLVDDDEEDDGGGIDVPEEWMELDEDVNPLLKPLPAKDGDAAATAGGTAKSLMERIEHNNTALIMPKGLPTHACITPSKAGESSILVPILYMPSLGITMEYHRRRYYYDTESREWIKIRCNTTMPLSFFSNWNGISSAPQLEAASIRFGENKFDVRQPTFRELYKAQLLSPFTVFQLFCVVLWMLDDYWQYSAFTLFMILTFEATVVFSRIKSLGALRGMGNRERLVHVYRGGEWKKVWTTELLPGDILSLTRAVAGRKKDGENAVDSKKQSVEDGDVVPADILLLRGSTVVNEASLTGESVPQMKEGMSELTEGEELDMKTRHKTHVLYAGTKMLQCKGVEVIEAEEASSDEEDEKKSSVSHPQVYGDIPNPPDGGCICFVLRTGFSSAQGKLVRMIEGSQEKVKGHERETALLLLLLFFFAVASSSYVLYHGLRNENRSQYELLLHCILIITSVIPPELPMQMALAVNNSLMTLMKLQIFCTEVSSYGCTNCYRFFRATQIFLSLYHQPYRVPMAGKLDACLFDKTGTLTTDELVPVGVLGISSLGTDLTKLAKTTSGLNGEKDDESQLLTPMTKLSHEASLVLAGCHSLVLIDGETTGDPLESAALKSMRWEVALDSGNVVPSAATEKKQSGSPFTFPNCSPSSEIEILCRHHFSSKLQRMSCVVKDIGNRRYYSVVKGSPEMVGKLLSQKPKGYDEAARYLSRRGYRVISLAYKHLASMADVEAAKNTRSVCEDKLTFAGCVAFTCRVRKDTKLVLQRLKEGGMSVAMVTGDALLTAIHVAKEVDICDSDSPTNTSQELAEKSKELKQLLEKRRAEKSTAITNGHKKAVKPILILEQDDKGTMFWQSYEDDSRGSDYVAKDVPQLAKSHDLAITGSNLAIAYEYDPATKTILEHFKVFARMSPDAKETVIECLHSVGKLCLMCGDGANDVGALKQADVGVALLSGFGDVNVDKGEDGNVKKEQANGIVAANPNMTVISPQDMEAARRGPMWLLKAKIKAIGVDLSKYPELTEREDLITLFEIKGRERAVFLQEQKVRPKRTLPYCSINYL